MSTRISIFGRPLPLSSSSSYNIDMYQGYGNASNYGGNKLRNSNIGYGRTHGYGSSMQPDSPPPVLRRMLHVLFTYLRLVGI